MSSADRRQDIGTHTYRLNTWPQRYGLALAAVASAALIRYSLDVTLGFTQPFVLFYPVIMLMALLGGLGPGLFSTFLSAALAEYFFMEPLNSFYLKHPRDMIGLALFVLSGVAMSWVCDLFRGRGQRLEEFQKAVEGLDEMIVVLDRDYRYLIANRAFLNYRKLNREQVIGRRAPDVLDREIFESVIKEKLDECFQGKIVQYEMQYPYPELGERNLFVSYFPIEGPGGVDRVVSVFQDITERRRAELALAESEGRFRALYERSPIGIALVDASSGRFLEVNPSFCAILGRTREEVQRLDFQSVTHPDEVAENLRRRNELSEGKRTHFELEKRYLRPNGEEIWASVSVAPLSSREPRTVYLVMAQDITARKKTEGSLQLFRQLIDQSNDSVGVIDPETLRLLDVNEKSCKDLQYSREEVLSLTAFDIDPTLNEARRALFRNEMKNSGYILFNTIHRRKDGSTFPVETGLKRVKLDRTYLVSVSRDMTDRKEAEDALRASEQRYRMLFEKNVAGVAILGVDGHLIDCNDAWARMFGYSNPEECRGLHNTAYYPDPSERDRLLNELKQNGAFFNRELKLNRKDGSAFWGLFNCVLIAEDGSEPVVQSTIFDITERIQAQEELRRREEDYRQFVAQSSEGIFRQELDAPIPIDLPEDELIHHILYDSYLAECNDAIVKMYGLNSIDDFVGKRLTETLDPEDPRNIELTRAYIRSGFRVLERESHETDMHGNAKVFRNSMIGIVEGGKLLRTWGIQRDVTEQVWLEEARTNAEMALKISEAHFRALVEQASDGIFIAEPSGKYIDVNSAGAEMLGYTREEILKLSIADVVGHDDVERVEPEVDRVIEGGVVRSEWTFRRKDGSLFPGEVSGKQLPDGRLQGIVRDMTERKRAEEAMRQSEERFRVALKDSPITVFNQDRDLRYTWVYNPQLHWQHDIVGKTDEDILGPRKAAALVELKRRVLKSGTSLREEIAIQQNGKSHAFDMTIEPLFDADGRVSGITGASMDIARLRELTDRLQDAKDQLVREKVYLESEIQTELGFETIIGQSSELRDVLKKARIVAPTDSTVLLLGETGTGKELVARSIHSLSSRRDKTFVKLNCAAVPSGLLESELFGHEKGAFTSAVCQKIGRIELAHKGTLFLDEIGELPLELQPKLLRVLQDREFERLGGVHTLHVDVRIISATNRDLRQDIADKNFREDLFYRLNVFPIELPSLRARRGDIQILVHHFVKKHAARMGKRIETIPEETMRVLQNWSWPGNIRELENMIERMVILSKGSVLAAPPAELSAEVEADGSLTEVEREHIIRILRETNGVLSGADGAANRLGVKRTTLQSMLKRLNIQLRDYRNGRSGLHGGWPPRLD